MRSPELLTTLLKNVSRSFYLTLRVLPAPIRPQIGLAYLLARATDTIADTALVSAGERLAALRELQSRISGQRAEPLEFGQFAERQDLRAERILLEQSEAALAALREFSDADQECIRRVLSVITRGQELDLERFGQSSASSLAALATDEDLDDYTYRVAGCVGKFWTEMCLAHLRTRRALSAEALFEKGIRFGKGLQLINILRDLPADLRQGRCYIPEQRLLGLGLQPRDLLDSANHARFQPLYLEYLSKAEGHLEAGWAYTNALPKSWARVRLACAWPILIGARTIQKLKQSEVLDPAGRVKISRAEVKSIIFQSVCRYPWSGAWNQLFDSARAGGGKMA